MGRNSETNTCNLRTCPFWGEWTPVGPCSSSCNGGSRNRTRACVFGVPGELGCEGLPQEISTCNDQVGWVVGTIGLFTENEIVVPRKCYATEPLLCWRTLERKVAISFPLKMYVGTQMGGRC